jgi:hypothetical protein
MIYRSISSLSGAAMANLSVGRRGPPLKFIIETFLDACNGMMIVELHSGYGARDGPVLFRNGTGGVSAG